MCRGRPCRPVRAHHARPDVVDALAGQRPPPLASGYGTEAEVSPASRDFRFRGLNGHPSGNRRGLISTLSGLQCVPDHAGLRRPLAKQTLVNLVTKPSRLYEQERSGAGAPDALGIHVRRWVRWVESGIMSEEKARPPAGKPATSEIMPKHVGNVPTAATRRSTHR